MADGSNRPIETLRPGDQVAALDVAGLDRDVPWRVQYQWLRPWAEALLTPVIGTISSVKLGSHEGFVAINGRLRLTPEHPMLVRRGDDLGFASAEFVQVGDSLIRQDLSEELVETVERSSVRAMTVAVHVPQFNMFLAGGVWTHNDADDAAQAVTSKSSGSSLGTGSTLASGQ